ncbi:NADH dehydrogenase FAD-containing subunit [Isoptericola sp. CG 20/1183]|uniref:NADH dehydrogenase FAD-containing subunit n=1 Tax=Isoptericola halotolerans TaxID=300560 RepID=A0ABX5EK38_9MICO|nr:MULTISPECIES: FAD-dependent oxidoreductase [Isoptericola]PRZ04094.1 NADH dehydrogenase FAD-containing subunit [Isoptericola sp. CG 20/1183]PRZ10081.1 NADH dehydrogenase FAD-containing subunit [Isoptericola halotolerans]
MSTHTTRTTPSTHVLVVGAGFAGGMAAVRLAGRSRGRVHVTVVNPRPTFVNRLRLHQVATGQHVPAPDVRRMLGTDVTFVEGWVTDLDPDAGRATVSGPDGVRTLGFDRVVLATGSTTEPVPVPGGEHAHGVADLAAAQRLRSAFADLPAGADVAVVGGGFTGLETVGELAGSRPDLRVRLVTSGAATGWFGPRAAAHVSASLDGLGIESVEGSRVRSVEPDRLLLDDGAEVPSDLTVWCGGFAAPPLAREAGLAVDPAGAVLTDGALQSVSHPQVMAVGDAGHTVAPHGGWYSMSCQFAFPSGAHAADVLAAEALGAVPDGGPAPLDLGFQGRCVSIGGRAAVLQVTDRDDVATDRAVTGRAAVVAKRFQVRGVVAAIGVARRVPGAIRWPGSDRAAAAVAAPVAG